jgi:hypothetical protein
VQAVAVELRCSSVYYAVLMHRWSCDLIISESKFFAYSYKCVGDYYFLLLLLLPGTAVAQWLRYCATNQKVAGSLPDGVMEFFNDINPSDCTMALGSTQPLNRNEYQEYFLGVNAAGA